MALDQAKSKAMPIVANVWPNALWQVKAGNSV